MNAVATVTQLPAAATDATDMCSVIELLDAITRREGWDVRDAMSEARLYLNDADMVARPVAEIQAKRSAVLVAMADFLAVVKA
ncbi:hypothetical protein [Streptomyces silvisoli]|uniref:Uncharacterized protein n=1 Tax=Streptomyces silvisoli TaxID=3034235 RepID=A0ABT5ZMB1_9ACTN|nr:hypothetical protein [Streptomyces silvisoli]MDF3290739.1 hypothetical protein [Streptomyces silvisoli]